VRAVILSSAEWTAHVRGGERRLPFFENETNNQRVLIVLFLSERRMFTGAIFKGKRIG